MGEFEYSERDKAALAHNAREKARQQEARTLAREQKARTLARQQGEIIAAKYKLTTGKNISPALRGEIVESKQTKQALQMLDLIELRLRGLRSARAARVDAEALAMAEQRELDRLKNSAAPAHIVKAQLEAAQAAHDVRQNYLAAVKTQEAALKVKLAGIDKSLLRPAAGNYHAVFHVTLQEEKDGVMRPVKHVLRGWAKLETYMIEQITDFRQRYPEGGEGGSLDSNTAIAEVFGWGATAENWSSAHAKMTIPTFERVEDAHELGTWDVKNVKLTRRGRVQPTLGCPAGRFVKAGGEIARPKYYREDSCMLSLFLECWADRLKTFREDLNFASLYRLATGEELVEGQPAGVSLTEAEKWLAHWRLAGRAINAKGQLVWSYDPPSVNKKIPGGNTWRMLVHDEHVWSCERENKEFDQKITARQIVKDTAPVQAWGRADISATVSDRWRRPLAASGEAPTFVTTAADVLALPPEISTCITNEKPESLFIALWEAGCQPGSVRLDKGTVDGFTVRIGERQQQVRIGAAIGVETRGEQIVNEALTSRTQVVFEEHLARVRAAFQPIDALSVYSKSLRTAFREYSRGPRVGRLSVSTSALPACVGSIPTVEFDVSRAYTSFLSEIEHIPVFSVFDEVRPYVADSPIVSTAFYLVRAHDLDPILFNKRYDFVPGQTVLYAKEKGIMLDLLGCAEPSRLLKTNGEAVLRAMYDDPECSDSARKAIANIGYGLSNKGQNKNSEARCFLNYNEAMADGGHFMKLGPGYLSVKQGSKDLAEGYLPVGRLVLDAMRRKLHATVAALGGDAVAVRVDAVYVNVEHEARARQALKQAGLEFARGAGWDKVGRLRAEKKDLAADMKELRVEDCSSPAFRPVPTPVCERIRLKNEMATCQGDWAEVDALMPTQKRVLDEALDAEIEEMLDELSGAPPRVRLGNIALEARCPGGGKTHLVKEWLIRSGQKDKSLIVCPWNALVSQLLKEGFRSITLHALVGRLAVETPEGKNTKSPYDCAGITHIHFEEAYLYPTHQVGWIAAFMKKNRGITFSMAGDPGQLLPVKQDLCVDSDVWYENAFATLFPRRICLEVSKRVPDEADRARMLHLCDELRAEERPVPDILLGAGLRVVNFADLTQEDARHPHLAAMLSTVARVDRWAHALIGDHTADYVVGEELLGVGGAKVSGGRRISSNETYLVRQVSDKELVLSAPDGSPRTISLALAKKHLKRPYCRTGHSTQGLSLGERIYIHDWGSHMATHRWVRTVISRCSTLDIVLVRGSEGVRANFRASENRIDGHRAADLAKKFTWDEADYVTTEWVAATLKRQRYSCAECSIPLEDDWSVDRKVNESPHLKENCQICCRRCQHSSAHRP